MPREDASRAQMSRLAEGQWLVPPAPWGQDPGRTPGLNSREGTFTGIWNMACKSKPLINEGTKWRFILSQVIRGQDNYRMVPVAIDQAQILVNTVDLPASLVKIKPVPSPRVQRQIDSLLSERR